MKTKLMRFVAVLLIAFTSVKTAYAQSGRGGGAEKSAAIYSEAKENIDTIPFVPAEVVIRGRQAIANHLMFQLHHVTLEYHGGSLVGQQGLYLSLEELSTRGYTHHGSFAELSDALASVPFSAKVVPTPDGYYDVSVTVTYWSSDNRKLFAGNGWLNIQRLPDGSLTAGQFEPWIVLNRFVAMQSQKPISVARWVGHYGDQLDLPVWYHADNQAMIVIPTYLLEGGNLLMADWNGNVSGWDLSNGNVLNGQTVVTLLGQIRSSDIEIRRDSAIDAGYHQFYRSGDKIYGRFPLIDITTTTGIKDIVNFKVPVWGSSDGIAPSAIYITPVYFDKIQPEGWTIGQEYILPGNNETGFGLNILPGEYHVIVEFNGVLDWEADDGGK